jgi:PadR family transcriptional regulator, regulatory protein PadR
MDPITELEGLLLLAVLQLGADAYGVTIRDEVDRRGQRKLTLGTIYKTLDRLESRGLLAARQGEPTPERGGKAKRFYSVTSTGRRAIRASFRTIRRRAAGLDLGLDTP